MKNLIFIFWILLVAISCGKEKSIPEELIGDWIYERELFNSKISTEEFDKVGIMSFSNDNTGSWDHPSGLFNYNLEWKLQSNDTEIWISKKAKGQPNFPSFSNVYDLKCTDENIFTFTFHITQPFEYFENIILTRIK